MLGDKTATLGNTYVMLFVTKSINQTKKRRQKNISKRPTPSPYSNSSSFILQKPEGDSYKMIIF